MYVYTRTHARTHTHTYIYACTRARSGLRAKLIPKPQTPNPKIPATLRRSEHGIVQQIPVRINTNLKAQTVEEVEGRRKELVVGLSSFHRRDLGQRVCIYTLICIYIVSVYIYIR